MFADDDVLSECRALMCDGADTERVLGHLRKRGVAKGESVYALEDLYGVSHKTAKMSVHFSRTWADLREPSEELHERLLEALRAEGIEISYGDEGPSE